MTFPTVRGSPVATSPSAATSHTIDIPTDPVAGNLLLLFVTSGNTITITDQTNDFDAAGFTTSLYNSEAVGGVAGGHWIVAKVATGADADSITLTTSGVTKLSAVCFEIQGWYGTIATGLEAGVTSYSFVTSTWDPPSLNPAEWGTEETLWLTGILAQGLLVSVTPPGGDYTTPLYEELATLSTDGNIVIYSANKAVDSENPGSFTSTTISREGGAFTIAIRPATSGEVPSLLPMSRLVTMTGGMIDLT